MHSLAKIVASALLATTLGLAAVRGVTGDEPGCRCAANCGILGGGNCIPHINQVCPCTFALCNQSIESACGPRSWCSGGYGGCNQPDPHQGCCSEILCNCLGDGCSLSACGLMCSTALPPCGGAGPCGTAGCGGDTCTCGGLFCPNGTARLPCDECGG